MLHRGPRIIIHRGLRQDQLATARLELRLILRHMRLASPLHIRQAIVLVPVEPHLLIQQQLLIQLTM